MYANLRKQVRKENYKLRGHSCFPLIIRSRYGSLGSKKENDVRTSCAVKQQVKKKRCHEKQLTSNENLPLAESGLGDTNAEQDWDFGEAP